MSPIHPIHRAQVIAYLKAVGTPLGLLLNFKSVLMKEGTERIIPRVSAEDDTDDTDGDDRKCGCSSAGASGAWAWLLVAGVLVRRRR